jgi:hypothetical protein
LSVVQVIAAVVVPGVAVTAVITGGAVSEGVKVAGALATTGDVALFPLASTEVTR